MTTYTDHTNECQNSMNKILNRAFGPKAIHVNRTKADNSLYAPSREYRKESRWGGAKFGK